MRCFACRLPPQIFSKMTKIGFKIPPILVDKFLKAVFNVYRNPRVRTELAETFTIARTFNSLKNVTRRPASISLGARNRGISKKTIIFVRFCPIQTSQIWLGIVHFHHDEEREQRDRRGSERDERRRRRPQEKNTAARQRKHA